MKSSFNFPYFVQVQKPNKSFKIILHKIWNF